MLIDMISVPKGVYLKGMNDRKWVSSYQRYSVEAEISKDFAISKSVVTQGFWTEVMESEPWATEGVYWDSSVSPNMDGQTTDSLMHFAKGPNLPAVGISWYDAVQFTEKLSDMTNRKFRLPTAVEWEYVYRAGTVTGTFWGEFDEDAEDSNKLYATAKKYAWFALNANQKIQPVSILKPNPWGVYDMAGNVQEWCLDSFPTSKLPLGSESFFPPKSIDFVGKEGDLRIACNGDYGAFMGSLAASSMNIYIPEFRCVNVGFRILEEL